MSNSWDLAWEALAPVFGAIVAAVHRANAKATFQMGRTKAAHFPFGAYLTFDQSGAGGGEDLVVSVDCRRVDQRLLLSCDISRGHGEILEDGPTETLDANADAHALLAWVDRVVRFLQSHRDHICLQLSSPGVSGGGDPESSDVSGSSTLSGSPKPVE